MSKDLDRIQHFVTENVYQQFLFKVSKLREKHQIQMYDEINVKQTTLLGMEVSGESLFVKVNITSRYMDYIVDENMEYIEGNQSSWVETENYLIFKKKIMMKDEELVRRCFSCGHPIDINQNGKCNYCGSIYNLESTGWILTSFEV